jgi:hypothetical protein
MNTIERFSSKVQKVCELPKKEKLRLFGKKKIIFNFAKNSSKVHTYPKCVNWKKFFLIVAILFLVVLVYRFYISMHNIDLAFNFWKVANCDYVSTTKCVEYKDLYIESFSFLEYSILCIITISLLIGFIIKIV